MEGSHTLTSRPTDNTEIETEAETMKSNANVLFVSKNYNEAATIYGNIIDMYQEIVSPLLLRKVISNRAACRIEQGRYNDALYDLNRALEIIVEGPESDQLTQKIRFRLALCFAQLGKFQEAMKELNIYRGMVGGMQVRQETQLRFWIAEGLAGGTPQNAKLWPMRFEIKVLGHQPFVKQEQAPKHLCSRTASGVEAKMFLTGLVKKHHDGLMQERTWTCWNCNSKATDMVHTPMSYLHLPEPMVVDFVQPVCVHRGRCDQEARKMMEEEMRLITEASRR